MSRWKTTTGSLALLVLVAGCGGGSGSRGSAVPTRDDVSPVPSTVSPGELRGPGDVSTGPGTVTAGTGGNAEGTGGSGSGTGPSGSGTAIESALRIDVVETPSSVQPGERMRVDWRTTSKRNIVETRYRWGTSASSRPNLSERAFSSVPGSFSYTDTLKCELRSGTIYVSVFAKDDLGASVESSVFAIPVRWTQPEAAVVFSATPNAALSQNQLKPFQLEVDADGQVEEIEVRIDLEHSRRGDLEIDLLAPSGQVIRLYQNPTDESKDLLGTFGNDMSPAQDLGVLRGILLRGTWQLKVFDGGSPATGVLRHWAIVVTRRATNAVRELALPNVVPLPPDDTSILRIDGRRKLAFGSRLRNVGPGPVQLRGELDRATGRTRAWQQVMNRLRDASTGKFIGWEFARELEVGDLVFEGHETHDHWHMAAVAQYSIRDERFQLVPGVGALSKVTRCLTDSRRFAKVEGTPEERNYLCGQARQGISVGWEDNYGAGTDGQFMDVEGLPDGIYWIMTEFMTRLEERGDDVDNNAATKIRITGDAVQILEQIDGATLAARRASAP